MKGCEPIVDKKEGQQQKESEQVKENIPHVKFVVRFDLALVRR